MTNLRFKYIALYGIRVMKAYSRENRNASEFVATRYGLYGIQFRDLVGGEASGLSWLKRGTYRITKTPPEIVRKALRYYNATQDRR